eukprot:g69154.t1
METLGFAHTESGLVADPRSNKIHETDKPVVPMAVFMQTQFNNQRSFFYPYFASLPKGCQNAICWPDDRLQKMFRPSIVKEIQKRREDLRYIATKLGLDPPDFLEKFSLVKSRYWKDPSNEMESTLVPIADMLNHAPPGKKGSLLTFTSRNNKGALLRQADVDAVAGDEIWDSYGEKHNGLLLKEYGFTVIKNPIDTCASLQAILLDEYINEHIVLPDGVKCAPKS